MARTTTTGSSTCRSRKRQKARSTCSGRARSSPAWVRAMTWRVCRGGAGHLVAGQRVAVDRVHASVAPDHLGQRHRDVAATGPDVDAAPARPESEPVERGGQGSAVDVVAQALELADLEPCRSLVLDAISTATHSTAAVAGRSPPPRTDNLLAP